MLGERTEGKNTKDNLGLGSTQSLNNDVLDLILAKLSPADWENAALVCTRWYERAQRQAVRNAVSMNIYSWIFNNYSNAFSRFNDLVCDNELRRFLMILDIPTPAKILVLDALKGCLVNSEPRDETLIGNYFNKTLVLLKKNKAGYFCPDYKPLVNFVDFLISHLIRAFHLTWIPADKAAKYMSYKLVIHEFCVSIGIRELPRYLFVKLESLIEQENRQKFLELNEYVDNIDHQSRGVIRTLINILITKDSTELSDSEIIEEEFSDENDRTNSKNIRLFELRRSIIAKTYEGNELISACRYAPEDVEPLLKMLSPEQAAAVILASSKNEQRVNALRVACVYAPEVVETLLSRLSPEQAAGAIFCDDSYGGDLLALLSGSAKKAESAKNALLLLIHKLLTFYCDQNQEDIERILKQDTLIKLKRRLVESLRGLSSEQSASLLAMTNEAKQTLIDIAIEKGNSIMIEMLILCGNNLDVVLKGQKVETVNYLYKHNYIVRPLELISNANDSQVEHKQPEAISLIGSSDRFFSSKESRSVSEIDSALGYEEPSDSNGYEG